MDLVNNMLFQSTDEDFSDDTWKDRETYFQNYKTFGRTVLMKALKVFLWLLRGLH